MSLIAAAIACAVIFVFGFSGFKSEAAMQGQSLGGWSLVDNNSPSMMKDEDSARIKTVLQDQGYNFNVLDLVATQVVSGANYMYLVYGTNYKALCRGNDKNLYVVTWYKDLQGNSSLTSAECVNIGAYSGL